MGLQKLDIGTEKRYFQKFLSRKEKGFIIHKPNDAQKEATECLITPLETCRYQRNVEPSLAKNKDYN